MALVSVNEEGTSRPRTAGRSTSSGHTSLFGLDGFPLIDAAETDDAVLRVFAETISPVLGFASCRSLPGRSKGRPKVRLREVCSAGRNVQVAWPNGDCERRSSTEQHPAVGFRRRTTKRCLAHLGTQIGIEARPVSWVAVEVGVSWLAGMIATCERVADALDDLAVVRCLGVDEAAFRKHRR